MTDIARRFLIASLLALFGLVTVGGPALHDIPGLGHHEVHESKVADGDSADLARFVDNPTEHCPVCHFTAQAAIFVAHDLHFAPFASFSVFEAVAADPCISFETSVSPRAPPRV